MSKEDLRIKFENLPDIKYYCNDDDEFVKSMLIKQMVNTADFNVIYKVFADLYNENYGEVIGKLEGQEFLLICLLNRILKNNNDNEL